MEKLKLEVTQIEAEIISQGLSKLLLNANDGEIRNELLKYMIVQYNYKFNSKEDPKKKKEVKKK